MRKIILTLIALVVLGGCGTTTCLTYRGDVYLGKECVARRALIKEGLDIKDNHIFYYDQQNVGHLILAEDIQVKNTADTLIVNQ